MELSIIIVSYNTAKLLSQCLESIANSLRLIADSSQQMADNTKQKAISYKLSAEIIVVDNGSTDGSQEYLKSQISNLKTKTQNLKLILNNCNLGFSKAVNQALRQVQGEVALLLNSDTIVKDGALGKLIEFERQVRPAIIGSKMLNPDGTVQGSCFFLPTVSRAISEYWLGKKKYFSKFAPESENPVEVEAVSGGAMLISKDVLGKIGDFDERYFMYFEDLDFCRRAKKHGFKVYYFPSAEIIHEHGASGKYLANSENQWKRLIPSSKTYHGLLRYYIIDCIIRIGQKIRKKC